MIIYISHIVYTICKGTFTIALSDYFRKILATEMNKTSVLLAQQAIKTNQITNIKIARLSSEDFTLAYTKKRIFQRLVMQNINFSDYDLRTVLVDPPRAALDVNTCLLLQKFQNIVYISCNPETLCRDLKILTQTHNICNMAVFDQFPYTHHLECGVCLKLKECEENSLSDFTVTVNVMTGDTVTVNDTTLTQESNDNLNNPTIDMLTVNTSHNNGIDNIIEKIKSNDEDDSTKLISSTSILGKRNLLKTTE